MLVIISDIHLTDGSSGETIKSDAFRIFRECLYDLAKEASWRKPVDGVPHYQPITDFHLVLLGDILDVIRSKLWLSGSIRPWSSKDDPLFTAKVQEITEAILTQPDNQRSLSILKGLTTVDPVCIPETAQLTDRGIAASQQTRPVQAHIHYMVGNHDWFYHLPGPESDRIRELIIEAMGLANPRGMIFPYDPTESAMLQKVLREHHVFARHGDKFDGDNFDRMRNASSLGDAIVVELLDRFPEEVEKALGKQVAGGLREIDNVRPVELAPVWLDGVLNKACAPEQAEQVKEIWNRLVDEFLGLDFVRAHHSSAKWGLKLTSGFSVHELSHLVPWGKRQLARLGIGAGDMYRNASAEDEFKSGDARFVVYGHTHHHEIVPLRSAAYRGGQEDQIYMNSGTWRAVHEMTRLSPGKHDFVGYHVMSYLAFFKEDERKGRAFESWAGALESSAA